MSLNIANSSKICQKNRQNKIRTSVLFVEFTKGGELQKTLKETMDRLEPMLEFRFRVAERGGTSLGSLLSNKNLWKGDPCQRPSCMPCGQEGEKKEPCMQETKYCV